MGKVYLIITCCIDNKIGYIHPDRRKQEYFLGISNCLNLVRDKNIIPIIVENSKEGSSYLDIFNCDKVYTNDNEFIHREEYIEHKGSNELRDIKKVIEKYEINDDDMIIKFTGRYMLFQDDFFKCVLDNTDKECFQRTFNVCNYNQDVIDIVMGLFAIKAKYLKQFEYNSSTKGCEEEFKTFIIDNIKKDDIMEIEKLYLRVILGDMNKVVDV